MNIGLALLTPRWPSWYSVCSGAGFWPPVFMLPHGSILLTPCVIYLTHLTYLVSCELTIQPFNTSQLSWALCISFIRQASFSIPFNSCLQPCLPHSRWLGLLISPRKWRLSSMNALNFPHLYLQNRLQNRLKNMLKAFSLFPCFWVTNLFCQYLLICPFAFYFLATIW